MRDRLTVPVKPPPLVKIIVVFVVVVAFMLIRVPRLERMLKSGGGTMILIVTELLGSGLLIPVIVTLLLPTGAACGTVMTRPVLF